LERDLQKALRTNIEQLEPGLKIADGGTERTVEAGRIDITAEDRAGKLVVIELKAGMASPDSLTQVLAYMAALEEEEQKPVRGMLVAGDFHDRLVLAARKVPDLQLKQYSFSFSFSRPFA
jgi:RecB family endonuclease NucS